MDMNTLKIICNGCGEVMRELGEWPVSFPRHSTEKTYNMQQAFRYLCRTCKTPVESYDKGVPVGISILKE